MLFVLHTFHSVLFRRVPSSQQPSGGANRCIYWVTKGGFEPWVRLPHARASQVKAVRIAQPKSRSVVGTEGKDEDPKVLCGEFF